MRKGLGDRVFKFVFIILLAAFCLGVVELMTLRFRMGDVYPAYSSLRTDPIGTKAYLESLNHVGISASRNYKYLAELQDAGSSTVFFFGVRPGALYSMDVDQVDVLKSLAASGNRVILLLYPNLSGGCFRLGNEKKGEEKEKEGEVREEGRQEESKGDEEGATDDDDEDSFANSHMSRSLRFSIDTQEAGIDDGPARQMMSTLAGGWKGLPGFLRWHSNIYFKDLGDEWNVMYAIEGLPVMIERGFGKGSMVLATDSYFVSNEAMLNDRHPDLLAWLVGSNSRVVFDETHLGIGESPGIASLMRKYNLHGMLAGLLVLAILFVWKNSSSLVPPSATEEAGLRAAGTQAGKDYGSGVVSLLRRNIPAGRILFICFEEWKKAFPKKSERFPEEIRRVGKVLARERQLKPRNRNPVKAYRDMSEILSERKFK